MKGFRQKLLSYHLKQNERPSSLEFLPATYPFWTRHAALTGMTNLDFDPTLGSVVGTDSVTVQIGESGVTFDNTPLTLAWFRFAAADGSYSPNTPVYKFPSFRKDASGSLVESFDTGFYSGGSQLEFRRKAITAYGTGPDRIWIKFFVFKDDGYINIDNVSNTEYAF